MIKHKPTKPERTAAIVYARFSPRPSPEECNSVEKQIERCRAYSAGHGYEVIAEYFDKDISGGRMDNRPGLQAALDEACKRKAVLVVYKLDRLARNTRECLDIVERLTQHGADLASLTETVNTRGAVGKFFITILAAFDTLVRDQIRERTSLAMRHHQANGRRMTRPDRCPYGWKVDPAHSDRLVEDSDEQAVIARILREKCEHASGLRAIARALEEAGIRCRGRRWSHSTIRAILERAKQLAEVS
jgi:site-specific DNA recombinase